MLHSEFIADLGGKGHVWEVRHIGAALREGFGFGGALRFYVALTIILLPSIVLAGYSIFSSRYGLLAWSVLAYIGFCNSSTTPTGIGVIACLIIAGISIIFALQNDWPHFLGGVLPGATWLGASAAKGMAMTYIEEKLRASAEYFAILVHDGNLVATPNQNDQ